MQGSFHYKSYYHLPELEAASIREDLVMNGRFVTRLTTFDNLFVANDKFFFFKEEALFSRAIDFKTGTLSPMTLLDDNLSAIEGHRTQSPMTLLDDNLSAIEGHLTASLSFFRYGKSFINLLCVRKFFNGNNDQVKFINLDNAEIIH